MGCEINGCCCCNGIAKVVEAVKLDDGPGVVVPGSWKMVDNGGNR